MATSSITKDDKSNEGSISVKIEEDEEDARPPSLSSTTPPSPPSPSSSKRRKDLFGDCALVEIIHLHDCLRGALKALERDVNVLSQTILFQGEATENRKTNNELSELERRVAGRFKVIWSVFRAHSSAEDEFIWPTLRSKTQGRVKGSPSYRPGDNYQGSRQEDHDHGHHHHSPPLPNLSNSSNHKTTGTRTLLHSHHHHHNPRQQQQQHEPSTSLEAKKPAVQQEKSSKGGDPPVSPSKSNVATATMQSPTTPPRMSIEQGEYEEDHADEERMFLMMDNLLTKLRSGLLQQGQEPLLVATTPLTAAAATTTISSTHAVVATTLPLPLSSAPPSEDDDDSVNVTMHAIYDLTKTLSKHLMAHLEKEEKQCMPLVVKHLTKSEIHDLVGKIMGKRSSDMIAQIMTMAVQNLNEADREEMVKYMQQAMAGTFFDRWLSMSGWMKNDTKKSTKVPQPATSSIEASTEIGTVALGATSEHSRDTAEILEGGQEHPNKRLKTIGEEEESQSLQETSSSLTSVANVTQVKDDPSLPPSTSTLSTDVTSQAELEHLIRAIVSNPNLSPLQKNTTIQSLRDSVWKSNQRIRRNSETGNIGNDANKKLNNCMVSMSQPFTRHPNASSVSAFCTPARRVTPPAIYYRKNGEGKVGVVWNSDGPASRCPDDGTVPLFSASELAPSYHDGATGAVLGCPHYARACKLRHPESGRLYTCRLCCEQERELPMKDQDDPLDRYAVTEVMCMKCNALQPADDRCLNPNCESRGKAYAKYFCRICHLYDDRPRPIFHCPYCNTCRMGLGLGIDFRHCMRCNACVSLADDDHRCIPQKLQGSCPICHESLFQSTEPLRGLKCGHVMHLSCFTQYRRGQSYTCPLCMRSMEDMSDYFALLDAAVRMQPMPNAYLSTISNIYCQDCAKTGQCQYHFVGQKCPHCGSYNTREMGRLQATDNDTAS